MVYSLSNLFINDCQYRSEIQIKKGTDFKNSTNTKKESKNEQGTKLCLSD